MVKVLIDNVVLNGVETLFFSVIGEDGPCGNFKLIERNPEKFGKHKVGEEFQLVVKPVNISIDDVKSTTESSGESVSLKKESEKSSKSKK